MENKAKIIYIVLLMLVTSACKNRCLEPLDKNIKEYYKVKDILFKNNENYYLQYSYSSRNGDDINISYSYEDKVLNVENDSIYNLKDVINAEKFREIKYPYFTDDKYIYVMNSYAGSPNYSFFYLDSNSTKILGSYIIDHKNIYYGSKKILDVETSKFNSRIFKTNDLPIELGFDSRSLFFHDNKLTYTNFQNLELNSKTKDSLKSIYFLKE